MRTTVFAAFLFLTSSSLFAESWSSRTVVYEPKDIVPVSTQIRYTTLVVLPETETILDYVVGDKDFWRVEGIQNFAYIKPAKPSAQTNVTLITSAGKVYSLVVEEVSEEKTRRPDLKLFIQDKNPDPIPRAPRFVPIEEAKELREALVQVTEQAEKDVEAFRRGYGASLHFVYEFKRNKKPFFVSSIYHDGKFTYIHSDAKEKPTLYEITEDDRTLNLIDFQMEDGVYVVPKVLAAGRLAIGKKKLDFRAAH